MRSAYALALALALSGCGKEKANLEAETTVSSAEPAFRIDAEQLGKEYRENEVRADMKYKGKVGVVWGKCGNITKSGDTPEFTIDTPIGTETIFCSFAQSHSFELSLLKPGSQVQVKGVCEGKGPIGGVFLKGCTMR